MKQEAYRAFQKLVLPGAHASVALVNLKLGRKGRNGQVGSRMRHESWGLYWSLLLARLGISVAHGR